MTRLELIVEILGSIVGAVCLFGSVFVWLWIGAAVIGVN